MAQEIFDSAEPIILAHVQPSRLGAVEIQPSTRQVSRDGRNETLEPRVMQVLVALAQAEGAVVTTDELIQRCWDGRIVGENAIHRVISRVRHVAATMGGGSFRIETIARVGYRLVVDGEVPETGLAGPANRDGPSVGFRPLIGRRSVIGGAAAALGFAAAAAYWLKDLARPTPAPAAVALYRRGLVAQRQGLPEQNRQAVAYFQQAVDTDPNFADAWGALALGYRHLIGYGPPGDRDASKARSRSAARRALAIDPDNADAQAALFLVRPYYRNWAIFEADCRRFLARHPDHWLVHAQLGRILCEVGRWSEGLQSARNVVRLDAFIPISHARVAIGLWATGRLQEAESVLNAAIARWPGHPVIWSARIDFLTYGGRPGAAIAFASDIQARPLGITDDYFALLMGSARAIETRALRDIEAIVGQWLTATGYTAEAMPGAARLCATLGRIDTAFALLGSYYFREGTIAGHLAPPAAQRRDPYTEFLFDSTTASLRADPRFGPFLERTGLERYWRSTGTRPDYRGRGGLQP